MSVVGKMQKETIRPDFDRSISIDFHGPKITSETGFLTFTVPNRPRRICE